MMLAASPYLLAQDAANVYYEFARLQRLTQWWHWLLLGAICLALIASMIALYRRDASELPRGLRWALVLLRLAAIAAVLFYFFDLEKRSERRLTKNSRALLAVDTSLSMGIQDSAAGTSAPARRIDDVLSVLARGDVIRQLRQRHDVVVYRFDQEDAPATVAAFSRDSPVSTDASRVESRRQEFDEAVRHARRLATVSGILLVCAFVAWVVSLLWRGWRRGDEDSWGVLFGTVGLLLAVVLFGVANLRYSDVSLWATVGLERPVYPGESSVGSQATATLSSAVPVAAVDWSQSLAPRGSETRLGDTLRYLVDRERGGPIAGIAVFTDGGNNAGVDVSVAAAAAADARIPLFAVGLGGASRPTNVAVVDVEAPPRVYPGDRFSLSGYLQAYGLAGRTVRVELVLRSGSGEKGGEERIEEERRIPLGPDGELLPVKFEVAPAQAGRVTYELRVSAPAEDHDARDNGRAATVEVVERKNRVLLLAGGPTREFQFLRNLLYRDRETTVDVLLQSGVPGISQEAHHLLFQFPQTAVELFEYDVIVAFDPDWLALDVNQVNLLEQWVAEKAGGLIVVAGPVQTPLWVGRAPGDERVDILKGLYPVAFYGRGSVTLSGGRFASDTAWPLQFARDGLDAEFLRLEDDALLSEQAWTSFRGVYGYFAVKDAKPGATVYARYSDPNTAIDGQLPIYLAGQFYGAGRVFFQASGEMWRVRAADETYFDRYYTKLIRWVSQGRLLRDSTRGLLLVDKDRCLIGDHVAVRAVLTDAQHLPLTAEQVAATLVQPDGRRATFPLRRTADATREGLYLGQFTALVEGDYRVELAAPQGGAEEVLTKNVRARIPALETERPQRNDALLKDMTEKTRGAYFVGIAAATQQLGSDTAPLTRALTPQDQVTYLPGTRDRAFDLRLMSWLMAVICGALSLEWLLRRLNRLA
jgi:hypothetical protein